MSKLEIDTSAKSKDWEAQSFNQHYRSSSLNKDDDWSHYFQHDSIAVFKQKASLRKLNLRSRILDSFIDRVFFFNKYKPVFEGWRCFSQHEFMFKSFRLCSELAKEKIPLKIPKLFLSAWVTSRQYSKLQLIGLLICFTFLQIAKAVITITVIFLGK